MQNFLGKNAVNRMQKCVLYLLTGCKIFVWLAKTYVFTSSLILLAQNNVVPGSIGCSICTLGKETREKTGTSSNIFIRKLHEILDTFQLRK